MVSQDYIDLNYSQGLLLLGVIYCPMLPALWFVVTWAEFEVTMCTMKCLARTSDKPFSSDANYTLRFFFTTFLLCAGVLGKWLASTPGSTDYTDC